MICRWRFGTCPWSSATSTRRRRVPRRLRTQIETDAAQKPTAPPDTQALEQLQAQERTMVTLDQRLQDLLREAETARVAVAEARAELDRRCTSSEAESATSRPPTIPERAVRDYVRRLCSAT